MEYVEDIFDGGYRHSAVNKEALGLKDLAVPAAGLALMAPGMGLMNQTQGDQVQTAPMAQAAPMGQTAPTGQAAPVTQQAQKPRPLAPQEINQIVAGLTGIAGFQLYRGSNTLGAPINDNAFWNARDKQMHFNRVWYNLIAGHAVDRPTAMALGILAHEIGHIGQPPGVMNQTGGMDVSAQFLLDLENQADAYSFAHARQVANAFYQQPHQRQVMAALIVQEFKKFRAAHPYTLKNLGG